MYVITATRSVARVKAARAGHRGLRRNPLIVMKNGSTIRLAPGKSVTISEEAYEYNKKLLDEFSSSITVRNLNERKEDDTVMPPPIPPVVPEEEAEPETLDPPAEESIQVEVEETVEAVVVEEPVKVEAKAPVKRRRKTAKTEKAEATEVVEDKPKRRRRSRKTEK